MREELYRIIKDYIGDGSFRIKLLKNHSIYFMKDENTGFSINCYRIMNENHLYQCNGSLIENGKNLPPFFFNSKQQFICNISYHEEKHNFNKDDILKLFSYLKQYYIKFYIKPYLKEKNFSLRDLTFFQISSHDLLKLRYYII